MDTTRKNLPLLLVFGALAVECLGIKNGHDALPFLLIILSPVVLIDLIFYRKMLIFPKYSRVFFVFFIFSSFISAFLGIGFYNSFINSLYLLSEFVVFVCFYNYRVHIKKKLSVIIFCIPILFSIYSLVLNLHILNLFMPYNGYPCVYE